MCQVKITGGQNRSCSLELEEPARFASPRGDSLGGRIWEGPEETGCVLSPARRYSEHGTWNTAQHNGHVNSEYSE